MDRVWTLHQDTPETAIDAQLSNWSFTVADDPVLLDVGPSSVPARGTRFDQEILLSAIRRACAYYRRKGDVAVTLHGRLLLAAVGRCRPAGQLHQGGCNATVAGGSSRPTVAGIPTWSRSHAPRSTEYYKQDAATLELFLRVRRLDRAARRHCCVGYDFILPGRVSR